MKNYLFACGVALLLGGVMFVGCGDNGDSNADSKKEESSIESGAKQNQPPVLKVRLLKVRSESEFSQMLGLLPNEQRFYVAFGIVGDKGKAVNILLRRMDNGALGISITLTDNDETSHFSLSQVESGLESQALVLKGVWNADSELKGKEFAFKVCESCELYEVDFFTERFKSSQNVEGQNVEYIKSITKAFIPQNNKIPQGAIENLNLALNNGAKDKQSLVESLKKELQDSFSQLTQDGGGLLFNSEYDSNIEVVARNKIITFRQSEYAYEGGAHGNTEIAFRSFSFQDGKELSNKIEDVFDMSKKDKILSLLSQKLEARKNELFAESLPLRELSSLFFITRAGIVMIWQPYEIAPYASGFIRVVMSAEDLGIKGSGQLGELLRKDSVYTPIIDEVLGFPQGLK
ncbi:DUF3298 and DUF4163 domain-containing protein [Helicobacter cinaedi]|uniref:Protein of uncharacterized function (DUF3298) n=1 Tax=Helicobacter cinaedi TaxID=213 RepID=A0A377JRE2_9HELI|nr:DUF3298 and DUF4163 domain-containing protein [Helicobacter cinaedi]STP09592.1 Protein of uncharacterised function (DUF3298) [Helicobacter cinaedi]